MSTPARKRLKRALAAAGEALSMSKVTTAALLVALPSVDLGPLIERPVAPVEKAAELVVVTRNSPTTRYIGPDGDYIGFEQDLVELFAKELGTSVRMVVRERFSDIVSTIANGYAHLAAAGLSATQEREPALTFGPAYLTARKAVVYNTDKPRPRSLKELVGKKIAVLAGSSSADKLKLEAGQIPGLRWEETPAASVDPLLDRLAAGKLDYVVTDSHAAELARNFYPNIATAFTFGTPEPLAWAMPKNADPHLVRSVHQFFGRIRANGTLRMLVDRHFGHIHRLTQGDIVAFLARRQTVLPRYADAFKEAQEITGIDWRLIAALGFQESHWNPIATSPTGVRGLMMLTASTADRLGVTDRLDPYQNILAGARYLQLLRQALPERIPEPDRTWIALAAYNVGYGHVEDARVLAQRQGLNPDSWIDLKKTLPLLARSDYYTTVRYGFARGAEAVILTENVRNYYDILQRFEEPHRPLLAPSLTASAALR
ncbi:MAG TPA: membrane-bound lytic murein transglycosylase MltF [Burkholderiales bacterium]|nr:membrane-bound lytic murein transglycosylase MltF [Burkholderiales bacterium]